MPERHEGRPGVARSTGSPDPDDSAGPLDTRVDPSAERTTSARPEPGDVTEASEESFPASDPPTWTGAAWSPKRRAGRDPKPSDQSPS